MDIKAVRHGATTRMQQEQSIFAQKSGNSFASYGKRQTYKGSCATGVTSGEEGGGGWL